MKYEKTYDAVKIKYIERELKAQKKEYGWDKRLTNLICGLSSDELKLQYLDNEEYKSFFFWGSNMSGVPYSEDMRSDIIASLDSDEEKVKRLETFKGSHSIAKIVSSISSDRKKIELYIKYKEYGIISSLSSDEFKAFLFENLHLRSLSIFQKGLKTNINGLKFKHSFDYTGENVATLSSDEEKIEILNNHNVDSDRYKVVASLLSPQYDDLKKKWINNADEFIIAPLIQSLSKDEDKEEGIKIIEEMRTIYMESLRNYKCVRMELIAKVVASFNSSSLKLKYFQKMKDDFSINDKVLIISSLGKTSEEKVPTDIITNIMQLSTGTRYQLSLIAKENFEEDREFLERRAAETIEIVNEKTARFHQIESEYKELEKDEEKSLSRLIKTNSVPIFPK